VVYEAVSRNLPHITGLKYSSKNEKFSALSLTKPEHGPSLGTFRELSNVVTIHVRRGDFEGHCWALAHFALPYASFNVLPGLPDVYTPDPTDGETKYRLIAHCVPDAKQIANKLHQALAEYKAANPEAGPIDQVFMMTNADDNFIQSTKDELAQIGQFNMITSRQLDLRGPEKFAAMVRLPHHLKSRLTRTHRLWTWKLEFAARYLLAMGCVISGW
jgi:hypothetical protein